MTELETQDMLDKIAQAVEQAKGDPVKEAEMLDALIDPQDNLNCEGCQQECYNIVRVSTNKSPDTELHSNKGNNSRWKTPNTLTIWKCRQVSQKTKDEEDYDE